MKVAIILVVLCYGATITSSALYGTEITTNEDWWNANFYIKFNSPSGKTFYIDFIDGLIYREKDPKLFMLPGLSESELPVTQTDDPLNAEKPLPFISFVSNDLKIYNIYFDDGVNGPRLEKSPFVYEYKYVLIRPRLVSFVGPNKRVYQVSHNDDYEVNIAEESSDVLSHFEIKTFGPYEKWEHTYEFSESGELVVDHTISPIPVLANRSISLPELEPNTFVEENYVRTFVKFNLPSGTKYHITTSLNIVPVPDDVKETAYITFTEPSGRLYDIHIDKKDGAPLLVANGVAENYYDNLRLYSFVAQNRILYRVENNNGSDQDVPILVPSSDDSSDLQITLIEPNQHYNKYVKYIFSDNGKKLFDRVDEIDWSPLNELPAVSVEEATADYVKENVPFLTLYTPSGNNYHIFTTDTNTSIAVEKGTKHSQNLYISYFQSSGTLAHIYFAPGADPYLEEETAPTGKEDQFSYSFSSFSTPDHKEYSITSTLEDDNKWKPSIQLPYQVKEPIDLPPVNDLFVKIMIESGWRFIYRFTWNGDKLIEASFQPPSLFIDNKVLGSLIGK